MYDVLTDVVRQRSRKYTFIVTIRKRINGVYKSIHFDEDLEHLFTVSVSDIWLEGLNT